MITTSEKTLYSFVSNEKKLILWISYVNDDLYDLNITDKLNHIIYKIAEFDGIKYNILNNNIFDSFYSIVKEKPDILSDIRSFIKFHKPESPSVNDFLKKFISNKKKNE